MRLTKDQAYIHRAQEKQYGEKDLTDKFFVIGILKKYYSIAGLTGEIVMIDDTHARCPDILIKARIQRIAIELDGPIHGDGDDITKRPKDIVRDDDYKRVGVQLIIINKSLTGYTQGNIMAEFDKAGLKRYEL